MVIISGPISLHRLVKFPVLQHERTYSGTPIFDEVTRNSLSCRDSVRVRADALEVVDREAGNA
jgi:hypothetical protein